MADAQQVKLYYADTPVSFEPYMIGHYFDPKRKQEDMLEDGEQKEKTFEAEFMPPLIGNKKSDYPNGVDYGGFFNNFKGSKLWGVYKAEGAYVATKNNELLMIFIEDRIALAENVIGALETQPQKPLHVIVEDSFKQPAEDTKDIALTLNKVKQVFETYAASRGFKLTIEGL